MRQDGLEGAHRRRRARTTTRDQHAAPAPDLVERDFRPTAPDRLWVADITYVRTWQGFLYLAVVLDCFGRRVVGWAMRADLRAELVVEALEMALWRRRPRGGSLVHHSDQGAQGGFKWWSQRLVEEACDGSGAASCGGSGGAASDALAGAAVGGAAGGAAGVLAGDRAWRLERSGARRGGRVGGGGRPVVPRGWRNAVDQPAAAVGPLLVVRRAGGDRAASRGRRGGAGDRAAASARALDDLARAASKRRDPQRPPRVPRHDGPMARRAPGAPAEAGQARGQRAVAALRAGAARRDGQGAGRRQRRRARGALDRPPPRPPPGSALGELWSPEQIAKRLPLDFPDDPSMRISHEAIYQALYVQGRGALRRELTACLRTGRALRVPRARTRGRGKGFVWPEIMISERPPEAQDRAVPGHWEGDLILGLRSSAIGTLVERTTRFVMLLHLPRMPGHAEGARVKNGPALAGHGAAAVRDAIATSILTLPGQLRRSLTWDQGAEMAEHAQLRIDTGIEIYFCDPHSPWQRGSNENTNGLLRQYFPRGTDLSRHGPDALAAAALALNSRPRKTLGWRTPAEALNDHLLACARPEIAPSP
jgi:transposase, IS30 family